MTQVLPQRHRIRLAREVYGVVGSVCSVTFGVKLRARVFANRRIAAAAIGVLKEHAGLAKVPIYGYCVMPDHVHLVLGPSREMDIVTFVGQFKNLTQRAAWRLGVEGAFWQAGFWDHFLRSEERVETAVDYVLHNPVRSGITQRWEDYPFCGSLVFDLRSRARPAGDKPPPYIPVPESNGC